MKLWKSFLVGVRCVQHIIAMTGSPRLPKQDLAGHEGMMEGQVKDAGVCTRTHITDVTIFVLSSSRCSFGPANAAANRPCKL